MLRYAFEVAETSLDPVKVSDLYSRTLTPHIYEGLYTYDHLARPSRIKPLTAEGMPEHSDDYRVWTVHLKPGILFPSDPAFKGKRRELVAQDYVYSFKRFADPANRSPVWTSMYDGSPAGPESSLAGDRRTVDWSTLWRFAADTGVTWFGAGAAFYASCLKADLSPQAAGDLSKLRAIGATGSPLALECYDWIWSRLPQVDGAPIWLDPISGGTDFAGAFIAGLPTLPVVEGEMQCRCLGAAVEAWSEPDAQGRGHPLVDEVGELVCVKPMPSMPLCFWGDPDGRRYRDSYFDMPRSDASLTASCNGATSRASLARSSLPSSCSGWRSSSSTRAASLMWTTCVPSNRRTMP